MSFLGDLQHIYVPSSRRRICIMSTIFTKVHIICTFVFIYRVSMAKKPLIFGVIPGRPSSHICTIVAKVHMYHVYLLYKSKHYVYLYVYISSLYGKKALNSLRHSWATFIICMYHLRKGASLLCVPSL